MNIKISLATFEALMNWKMNSDPSPLDQVEENLIIALLNQLANKKGYKSWIEAFHRISNNIEEIYVGGQLFPVACPKSCPGLRETFEQGGICHRCPIFNCTPDKEGFCLIEPHNYRQDWAKEFRTWFNNGWIGYPLLKI